MRIAFVNRPADYYEPGDSACTTIDGRQTRLDSGTAPEMNAICERAMRGLVGSSATAEAVRDAMLAAVDNLRADVLAAEIVDVTPQP